MDRARTFPLETPLNVSVRLFALYRERAGTGEAALDLPDGATVGDAIEKLLHRFPKLAPAGANIVVAVNAEYAEHAAPLKDGDELALIPPVSGGQGSPAPTLPGGKRSPGC